MKLRADGTPRCQDCAADPAEGSARCVTHAYAIEVLRKLAVSHYAHAQHLSTVAAHWRCGRLPGDKQIAADHEREAAAARQHETDLRAAIAVLEAQPSEEKQ